VSAFFAFLNRAPATVRANWPPIENRTARDSRAPRRRSPKPPVNSTKSLPVAPSFADYVRREGLGQDQVAGPVPEPVLAAGEFDRARASGMPDART